VDISNLIQTVLILALPVIFGITVPAAVRGRVANRFGDPTATLMGRVSLNPLKHIDPIGTLLIPAVLYIVSAGAFLFGYAKPVPFDPRNLRNPKRDIIWVSLAAPLTNFAMAAAWLLLLILLRTLGVEEPFFLKMAAGGVQFNLVMWALNLFPLPPFDGGHVLMALLPRGPLQNFIYRIEPYGFFIVMGLMIAGLFTTFWLRPLVSVGASVLDLLFTPLKALLL
jgi:Zn-dependent protease